jgi:hypothetical protein
MGERMTNVLQVDISATAAQSVAGRREVRTLTSPSHTFVGRSMADVSSERTSISTNSLDPTWLTVLAPRLLALASHHDGWDSYGGYGLQPAAFEGFLTFLSEYRAAIQSAPSMSLTPAGGLHAQWRSAESEIAITFEPDGDPEVLFERLIDGDEAFGKLSDFSSRLTKWLWMSSMVT